MHALLVVLISFRVFFSAFDETHLSPCPYWYSCPSSTPGAHIGKQKIGRSSQKRQEKTVPEKQRGCKVRWRGGCRDGKGVSEQKEKRVEIQNSHQLKLLFPWQSWKSWLWLTWWPRLNHLDCCSPGPNRWNNVAPLVFFSFFAKAAPAGRQQEPLSGRHDGAFPKKTTLLWSCVGELFTLQKGRRAGFWSQTVDFFQSGHSWFSKPTFWKQTMIGQRSEYFYCL